MCLYGYTEYLGEKVASFITNGAVELYHNNIKTFETTAEVQRYMAILVMQYYY